MSIPEDIRTWIQDFCDGKTSVEVGHMMFSSKENLSNLRLERALYLIREHKPIQNFVCDNPDNEVAITEYVAAVIRDKVLATFKTARYPGD